MNTDPSINAEPGLDAGSGVSDVLRELSGIDDAQSRLIVATWNEWQVKDVVETVAELREVVEIDRSLEFDALFRAALTFPEAEVRLECVRGMALRTLAAMRHEDSPDIIDSMFDEAIDDPALMSDVLLAMGESGDRSWLPTVEDAFFSNYPNVRIAAVLAFGSIAGDDDIQSLSEPFDDHILEVQIATIQTLEQIGTPQAQEMLSLAVSSSEPDVQQLAQAALDALKAEDDLIHAVSPTMVERGLFGVPAAARNPSRDMSRYDAATEEGWVNVNPEGQEVDVAETPEDIGEDYEDYLESDEFFRESNVD